MIAKNIVSANINPLLTTDSGKKALDCLAFYHLRHLPLVEHGRLVGLLSEDDFLSKSDLDNPIGSHDWSSLASPAVLENDHLFDVMRVMTEHQLTAVPVATADGTYIGVVTQEELLKKIAQISSFADPGSILEIIVHKRDYSLAEICRLVESEGASVLSSYITSVPNAPTTEISLKINRQALQSIVATLERYDYEVKGFAEPTYHDALQERYDALLSYLNV